MDSRPSGSRVATGGGGGRFQKPSSYSTLGKVLADSRTRQLQVASGGRYKYVIVSKIISYLKTQYLEVKEVRPTLKQLLEKINEPNLSDALLKWFVEDGLAKHPRVRIIGAEDIPNPGDVRVAYEPPIPKKYSSTQAALVKLLKKMYENEGPWGLLRTAVEDSTAIADRYISTLEKEGKITVITRVDKAQVLFYKPPEPDLDKCVSNPRFAALWRKVDVCNKEKSHIQTYLKNRKLKIFDDERVTNKKTLLEQSRKRKNDEELAKTTANLRKRVRRSLRNFKDNAHVQLDLLKYDEQDKLVK